MAHFLGIDVGSVSTNLVLTDETGGLLHKLYLRTGGRPQQALAQGLGQLAALCGGERNISIAGVGATGSGRELAGALIGADVVKNEITAHATAALRICPDVRTILEIGGQDSKIIFLRSGVPYDFAMNTVCAAGTGSFLDRQAERLGMPIAELGGAALRSKTPTRIAGRCAVFAESDMIHKQQTGHSVEDIVAGLCDALVRNYLGTLAKGRKVEGPVLFQGGVAANRGIIAAFERQLGLPVTVPEYYDVMGAWGAALLARRALQKSSAQSAFRGFSAARGGAVSRSYTCTGCPNHCEIVELSENGAPLARWGGRCERGGGGGGEGAATTGKGERGEGGPPRRGW